MALYENGKRISGIRDFPAYTWAEYHALPAAQRPKVWKCTDRNYTDVLTADDISFDPTVKNILPNTATDCQKAIDALCSPNYVILARTDSSVSLSNQNLGKYKFLILATEYANGILTTDVIPTGFFVGYPPLSAHATPQVGSNKNIYAKINSVSGTLSSCSFTVAITNPSGDLNFKALLFGVY